MSPGGGIAVEYEIQCALGRLRSGSVQDRAKVWHLHGMLYLQRNEPKMALVYLNQALNDDSQLAIAIGIAPRLGKRWVKKSELSRTGRRLFQLILL
jgi:hypothetical protein